MQKKINILYIIDSLYGLPGGGTENHLLYLMKYIDNSRFNCLIVAFGTGDSELTKKIKKYADILHVPVAKFYSINGIKKAFYLSEVIKQNSIDIVQTFHFKSDVYGTIVSRIAGCRLVVSSKRDVGDLKRKRQLLLHKMINSYVYGFIAVSQRVAESVVRNENVDPNKITIIYNGVDTEKFKKPTRKKYLDVRSELNIEDDDIVFGMVAVFRPEKNHDILIKSFEKVLDSFDNIKLLLVGGEGDGYHLYEQYRDYCIKHGLTDKIIFTGATSRVHHYLAAMDVACLVPGSNEGFSNSILEKMATGLPLIVTDVGGNAEAVQNGVNGFVIPPLDIIALSNALKELYNNQDKRNAMGECSRKRAEKLFSLDVMIATHQEYYESIFQEAYSAK